MKCKNKRRARPFSAACRYIKVKAYTFQILTIDKFCFQKNSIKEMSPKRIVSQEKQSHKVVSLEFIHNISHLSIKFNIIQSTQVLQPSIVNITPNAQKRDFQSLKADLPSCEPRANPDSKLRSKKRRVMSATYRTNLHLKYLSPLLTYSSKLNKQLFKNNKFPKQAQRYVKYITPFTLSPPIQA